MTEVIDDRLELDQVLNFNNSFKKEDYYRIPPSNGVENVNRSGNISFRCSNREMYLSVFDSVLRIKVSVKGLGDTMCLEHNAVLRMFDSAKLTIGTSDLENISSVCGEATTMVNLVVLSAIHRMTNGAISGWFPDDHKDADKDKNRGFSDRISFYKDGATLMIPLKLIFGFTDYRKVIHHIENITLTLNRKSTTHINSEIFYGTAKIKTAANVDINPEISFSEIEWWIPSYTLNLAADAFYTKRLNTKKTFDMTYMRRHSSSVSFTSSKYQWTITGISKQVRYVFVAFKAEANDISKNNALFTAKSIRSVQIRINGQLYPIQPMKLNTDQGDIAEPYLAYIDACNAFGNECQLKVHEFRDLYPVFCFNTSSQAELMQHGNEAVAIIEKSGNDSMEVFAVCFEDSHVVYNIANGVLTEY